MEAGIGERLIEEQIKRWELAQRTRPEVHKPCVALSRMPGTPANELGQRLAERLDYGYFGIELVDEVARTQHVARHLVAQLDEHVRNGLDRWLMDTFHDSVYTERDYLHNVARSISALGEKGAAVIIGRGAPFVLGSDKAIKIQIIAPREVRVQRLAQAKNCTKEAAAALLREEEVDRLKFLREFVEDPDNPLHFDLVINTGQRTVDYWLEVLVEAVEGW